MIAHRGGYDLDDAGENSVNNILYTCQCFPDADIEIDVFYHENRFVVCHDPPTRGEPLLDEILGHLDGRFHNILYLDIKSDVNPKSFFDLLSEYRIRYRIHSFIRSVVEKLQRFPVVAEIGYASETGNEMPADYLVFPKGLFRVSSLPILWYTFNTAREAKKFLAGAPKDHDCFVDYLHFR